MIVDYLNRVIVRQGENNRELYIKIRRLRRVSDRFIRYEIPVEAFKIPLIHKNQIRLDIDLMTLDPWRIIDEERKGQLPGYARQKTNG